MYFSIVSRKSSHNISFVTLYGGVSLSSESTILPNVISNDIRITRAPVRLNANPDHVLRIGDQIIRGIREPKN